MNPFLYCPNPESDEPIMLIDKHIGYDDEDGHGIDGSLFTRELMQLDSMNKKSICVWINSPGGIVMDGYDIYNSILRTKTKVDTLCVGIAASIAAVIFQAGRKRIMNEHSLLMYHNPYGGNSDELKKMKESIAQMIASRTSKAVEEVLKIMDRTTWIKASEAFDSGFCDEIHYNENFNKKHGNQSDAKAMWKSSNLVLNSIFKQKNKQMTKVANKLGLNQEANEESILSAISAIENKLTAAIVKNEDSEDKLKKMEDAYEEAKKKCEDLEMKIGEFKKKAEDAEAEEKKSTAKNMIENFVKAGRIKNESSEKWIALASNDLEGTEELLKAIPVNKVANKINEGNDGVNNVDNLTNVVAKSMAELRTKNQL